MTTRVAISRARLLRIVPLAFIAVACPPGGDPGPGCTVTAISVQPTQATLNVGETATLTASVSSSNCSTQPAVTWTSGNTASVGIVGNGGQATVTALAPTSGAVNVTAAAGGMSATTQITVLPLPAIALSSAGLTYNATQGGANPASQSVTITNSGGGTLSGLSAGTITYGSGATGWLQTPTLSGTTANPSVTLTLQPVTGSLVAGTYTATVPVQATGSSNSPQNVTVTFIVAPPPPAIALSSASLTYNAMQGGANPASQAVTITNGGGGTLSGLSVGTITYGSGATGWLQTPILSGTTANPSVTLTLQPATGSLTAGTYTATVPVLSGVASNSPRNITVTFVVAANPPTIALSPTGLTFNATEGGANPASQAVTITNGGGGTLSGLSVGTITYGSGATGWLQTPTMSGTTASPSVTLTIQPVTGSLTAGTYTATVPVLSGVASNSPQNVTVTFTVVAATPVITLTPTSRSFSATAGGANPASQSVTITNGGSGTLSGLSVGTVTYGSGATGWLQTPTLSGTTASPSVTLTLQPVTGSLAAGTYTATVPVLSGVASNSPQNVTVTFVVAAAGPTIALNPTSLSFTATVGGANPASLLTTITNGTTGTLSGLSVGTVTYGSGASGWLQTPVLSGTTASPSVTLTVQPVTGSLAAGTYTATVPVLSGVASNSPRNLAVSFTVNALGLDPCAFANATPIAVGQTVGGNLATTTSCLLGTGHYANLHVLTLTGTTNLQVDLTSSGDPFLTLLDFGTGAIIEEDDDDGPGLNSQIVRTLSAGQYILRATTFAPGATGPYTLSVQAVVGGTATRIVASAGNGQTAAPGAAVAVAPSATVLDAAGFGVAGVTVTFATVTSVGSITGAVATSDANGIATVGSWTLAAGANALSATASGITTPAVFSATGTSSRAGFTVDLRFITMPSLSQLQAFSSAAARWQAIVTNDLADIPNVVLSPNACASNSPAISENIDDLVIQVSLTAIDGPGGILGSAGPCFIRTAGSLPLLGAMQFDVADLANLEANGSLNAVILHEMGHIIGIGTLWTLPAFNLLANPSLPSSPGVDTRFTGVNGIAGFDAIGGTTYTGGGKVPVENTQGGQGTRDAHWRESVLVNELMTGFLNAGANPLSVLTVRSLQDLGYTVDVAAADPFFLTLTVIGEGGAPRIRMLNDVREGPIYRVDGRGRVTDLEGRAIPASPAKR